MLVSGVTVMIAMAGMLLAGSKIYTSLAIGAMIVVAMSVVGSLTVLPAILGKLGDSIDRGAIGVLAATLMRIFRRQPRLLRWLRDRRTLLQVLKGGRSRDSRLWAFVVRRALRRPVAAVVGSTAVLLALALPALGMHLTMPGFADVPQGTAVAKAHAATQQAFPGASSPATVVVRAPDVTAPAIRSALADLRTRALATGDMADPIRTTVNRDHTVAEVEVPLAGDGEDAASNAALDELRSDVIPASLGRIGGVEYAVTGQTAGDHDFIASVRSRAPLVFAFVLGLAFLVLLVTFRSIVVPLKAIVLNLLSVGAAYGVLVLGLPARAAARRVRPAGRPRRGRLAAAVPVHRALRPLDGLPRLRAEPDPRAGRPRAADAGRRRAGHPPDGGHGHERGGRDGRGVRDLRVARRRPTCSRWAPGSRRPC